MLSTAIDVLRCPYCGGHVSLLADVCHEREAGEITSGILACHCARFPIAGGIAVMTVEGVADTAREQVEAGEAALAVRTMFAGGEDALADGYDRVAADDSLTYRDVVAALGPGFAEGRYFLYRFSDPTFLVADAVVRTLAGVVLRDGGRAIDLCGGSGHLTRTLQAFTPDAFLMDWSFPKLWLARRYTAPGAQLICGDAHTALPFATNAFRLAVCSDAFHYVWTKALLAHEMARLTGPDGAVAVTHTHNSRQENPSAGMPLPPGAYRELFEDVHGRVFSERTLLEDVVGGKIDLSRMHADAALDSDPALTIVGSHAGGVFARRGVAPPAHVRGELRINPLYVADQGASYALRFPSEEYEQEYGQCRMYLPERVTFDWDTRDALARGDAGRLAELLARRVVLDLPPRFY